MMKKLIILLIVLLIYFSLGSCSAFVEDQQSKNNIETIINSISKETTKLQSPAPVALSQINYSDRNTIIAEFAGKKPTI